MKKKEIIRVGVIYSLIILSYWNINTVNKADKLKSELLYKDKQIVQLDNLNNDYIEMVQSLNDYVDLVEGENDKLLNQHKIIKDLRSSR